MSNELETRRRQVKKLQECLRFVQKQFSLLPPIIREKYSIDGTLSTAKKVLTQVAVEETEISWKSSPNGVDGDSS